MGRWSKKGYFDSMQHLIVLRAAPYYLPSSQTSSFSFPRILFGKVQSAIFLQNRSGCPVLQTSAI